jgi:hypothetical protein
VPNPVGYGQKSVSHSQSLFIGVTPLDGAVGYPDIGAMRLRLAREPGRGSDRQKQAPRYAAANPDRDSGR